MERDLAATATDDIEAAKPLEKPTTATTKAIVLARRWLGRAWRARGFFGGLGAMALAALGQYALVDRNDQPAALLYYATAIALLIASLLHPTLPRLRLLFRPRVADPAASQPIAESIIAPPLPTRSIAAQTKTHSALSTQHSALRRLRARLGWRATVAGLALTGALAGASLLALNGDVSSPLGGWLWAAALAALLLTFLGAEGWPRGNGLLPAPRNDFFGRGLPVISVRWEALLAGAVLLVALGLRLYNLEYHPGIFGDEGERGMDARSINEGDPANIFGFGWWSVPNLYFYLVAIMLRVFGDNMVGDRMLSVISGMAAIWFVYRIGRLLWGPRAGLIAGAMLAVSPLALQFSRIAGESTPTGALWAGGFYFLFMALRYRRFSDWALAGILWGFSLYFYAAGKLIIPLVAVVVVYCLVRWRLRFFKQYALGFALAGLSLALTFMPNAILSAQEGWLSFTARAQETSIFTPQNQARAFATYNIAYDPSWISEPLVQAMLHHPLEWAQLLFGQVRVTAEVIYAKGDPTAFYQINEHGGSMLPPLWAALALLGLAYAAWKMWDARFGIASIWFWGGMMGAALTLDTPSVQRLTGAWPAIMLFPAVMLDLVFAAAWPLFSRQKAAGSKQRHARLSRFLPSAFGLLNLPLAALLIFFGGDGYREYFVHYASLCPYCLSTLQARFAQSLGQDYRAYELGVGDYDVFFDYGSTRFAAKGVEGGDLASPVDFLPVTNNGGKGAAFIVYPMNYQYLPLIKLFYPGGEEKVVKGVNTVEYFTTYKLTREQMTSFQAVKATYASQGKQPVTRSEAQVGNGSGGAWGLPTGFAYPVQATWEGGLVAPVYGLYTLAVTGGAGTTLELDGKLVLRGQDAFGSGRATQTNLVLAKGIHQVRLSGTLRNGTDRIEAGWAGTGSTPGPIPTRYLYSGPVGGLSGEVGMISSADQLLAKDPWGQRPIYERRTDPALGFREATTSFGRVPFQVRWQGIMLAPSDGAYTFDTASNGPSAVLIDDQVVVNNQPNGPPATVSGTVTLRSGPHAVDVRYMWNGGRAMMEWYWKPPQGERVLVSPTVLIPKGRSWQRGEVLPDPPSAQVQSESLQGASQKLTPDAVFGAGDLSNPRGLAVDAEGNVYVGDRDHHRVAMFGKDGKLARTFGKASPPGNENNPQPGELADISDVGVGSDGAVYVLDTLGRVQIFNKTGELRSIIGPQKLGLFSPNGIFTGLVGDAGLYIADTGGSRVLKLSSPDENAQVTEFKVGSNPQEVPPLDQPLDVVASTHDNSRLYVIDLKDRIVEISTTGAPAMQWRIPVARDDGGSRLAISPDGAKVYMSDSERQRVAVLDTTNGSISFFGETGKNPGQFSGPSGIAVGPDGRVYVADRSNNNVQVFTLHGGK